MLNANLSHSELIQELGEYVDRINFILSEIYPQKINIVDDKQLMGKLHHALNISNYKNSSFRKLLLRRANKNELEVFIRKVNADDLSITSQNVEQLINNASKLPWSNNAYTRDFVETFGYEENLIPKEFTQTLPYEVCKPYDDPLKALKDYQTKIFFKCASLIEIPWNRFIIRMPTGAGKTRTAMEAVCHFLNDDNDSRQVVWIADREELCEQAINNIMHIWPHMGKHYLNIYRLWGSRRHDKFDNPSFIVATYQTLANILKNKQIFPEPQLIITDEAHNVLAPTHQHVLDKLTKHKTRIMGLTATPIRSTNVGSQKLRDYFFDQIIEIDSGNDNTIEYLQQQGYLAHCITKSIPSNREYRLTKEQRQEIEKERDLPAGFLDQIANDDKRNVIIADILLKLKEEEKQVLYFAPSVEQSKFMCMILLAKNAKAAHIDGNTPIEYRRDVISKFRDKKINFIFNFNVFATGFDAPNIDVVFIARPTRSRVLHQQMIGRGMRGPKMGGTNQFSLYRIVDTMPEIALADEYFTDFWQYTSDDGEH